MRGQTCLCDSVHRRSLDVIGHVIIGDQFCAVKTDEINMCSYDDDDNMLTVHWLFYRYRPFKWGPEFVVLGLAYRDIHSSSVYLLYFNVTLLLPTVNELKVQMLCRWYDAAEYIH